MKRMLLLHAVAVAALSFLFLNLAFLLDFAYQSLVRLFIQLPPTVIHFSFVFLIAVLSRFILKSKIPRIIKAAYFTVPLAVVYATTGMFAFYWLGVLFGIGSLIYLLKTKRHWFYLFAWGIISLAMLLGGIFGMDI